jgi:phospholipid/cholesterol/gamma-HCH transport system substrate-binding protein
MTHANTRMSILGFLGVTLLALGALLVFARYPAVFRTGVEYRTAFANVGGLNRGTAVRFGGIPVGMVTDMELDATNPKRVVVHFRVKRNAPVRADTRAAIAQVGFLGEPYLNLRAGRANAPPLAEHAVLASDEAPSLQEAVSRVASFLDRADTLVAALEKLSSASPLQHVDATLARIDRLVDAAGRGTTAAFAQLDHATQQVARASDELSRLAQRSERLVVSMDTIIRASGPGLASVQRDAEQTLRDVRSLVAELRDGLDQGGGVDQLMRNLSVATDKLARLTTRIERDPSSVLKKPGVPSKAVGPSPDR